VKKVQDKIMKKREEGEITPEIRYTNMEMYQLGNLYSLTRCTGGSPD
jgi:hypothetical protein